MHSAGKRVYFADCVFEVCENVYEPSEDSFLFAEHLEVRAGARVLDMGTGTGILGILAAKQACDVLSMDLNPYAVRCSKRNAQLNNTCGNMRFLQGDLFTPLAKTAKFDLVFFNAPYLPSEPGEEVTWLGRAWAGGASGRQVIDRFISQVTAHLGHAGEILLMQSTLANIEETKLKFEAVGMRVNVVTRLALPFFETLALLRATF
jgi:release factor glutamine methyltransferase